MMASHPMKPHPTFPPGIYEAITDDVPVLVNMGRRLHLESDVARHELDPKQVAEFVMEYILDTNKLCLIDSHAKGFFLAAVCRYSFANATFAREEYWYVKPEYRASGRLAMKFLKAFKDWAEYKNADDLFIGTSTGINVERSHKLMNRLKFTHVGGFYRRPVNV